MSDRETLAHFVMLCPNDKNATAIRAVLEENERLRGALEGQPVIKSEWEEKCAEVERLRKLVREA